MKCEACGNENRWCDEREHEESEFDFGNDDFALCECGHEQEKESK